MPCHDVRPQVPELLPVDGGQGPVPCHDAFRIFRCAVLAHLPLAGDLPDRKLDADDRPELPLDVIVRRIRDLPGRRTGALMGVGEARQKTAQPLRIVDSASPSST